MIANGKQENKRMKQRRRFIKTTREVKADGKDEGIYRKEAIFYCRLRG